MATLPALPLPETPTAERSRLMLGGFLGMISLATQTSATAVCLLAIAASFDGLSGTQMGAIATSAFTGVVTGIIFAGPLADRYGMRRFLIAGAALEILGQLAIGLSPTYWLLLFAGFCGGLGAGALDALLSPLICAITAPERRTGALNLLHAFYSIGAMLALGAATALLASGTSWRAVFPLMTIPAWASLMLFITTPVPCSQVADGSREPVGSLLRQPALLGLLAGMMLVGAAEHGPWQWIPAYMARVHGWTQGAAGLVIVGYSVTMAVGRLAVSLLARRFDATVLLLGATSACLVCILGAAVSPPAAGSAVGLVLLGLAVSSLWPTMLAYTERRHPRGGATLFSLLAGMGNMGGVLGPIGVGMVGDAAGLRAAMGSVAALPLLLLVFLALRRRADGA